MSGPLIEQSDISVGMLKSICEDAAIRCTVDNDGDLVLEEGYKVWIHPDPDRRWIRITVTIRTKEGAPEPAKLRFVNDWNERWILVRAAMLKGGAIAFDYYLWTDGGMTRRGFVSAVKRMLEVLGAIGQSDTGGNVF